MTQLYYEKDADPAAVLAQTVAIVGYSNQGPGAAKQRH